MNSQQAKQIDLPDLLSRLGFKPIKITKGGKELWYPSPFRKERTPSFHTSFLGGKWIWKDFGDAGGNVIDFVMRYQNLGFKGALAYLRNVYQSNLFEKNSRRWNQDPNSFSSSFQQRSKTNDHLLEPERELEFLEAHDIRSIAILSYLEKERCIPASIAKKYLKEVKYKNLKKGKTFFAIGMENESGGYEIRSASDRYKFKSALIKRDISVVSGRAGDGLVVNVFEGMTDFLSLMVLLKTDQLEGDAIIMHSVSTYQRTKDYIAENAYRTVNTFLDNDKTGKKYTDRLVAELECVTVVPQNRLFHSHQDLNGGLVANEQFSLPHLSL